METNKLIAEWLGWSDYGTGQWWTSDDPGLLVDLPDFENSDVAAVTLLPELVNKGFWIDIGACDQGYSVQIGKEPGEELYKSLVQPTFATAVTLAVINLIGGNQ